MFRAEIPLGAVQRRAPRVEGRRIRKSCRLDCGDKKPADATEVELGTKVDRDGRRHVVDPKLNADERGTVLAGT